MNITIDLGPLIDAAQLNPALFIWYLFVRVGWLPVLFILGKYFWDIRLGNLQYKYLHSFPYSLLAIDVPRLNEQSSKAVEQIFAQFAGAKSGANFVEKYFQGKTQESFSLEMISLGGYIQYLIRTPSHFRDLVEAAIYAQYPDADITEVEDYAASVPVHFPSEEIDLWGTELQLANKNCYPIRTYPMFEHALAQTYADPMAALLEIMSRLGPSEQLWIQWVLTPVGDEWKKEGAQEVKKLIGAKVEKKTSLIDHAVRGVGAITGNVSEVLIYGAGSTPISVDSGAAAQSNGPNQIQYLSPGERAVVEAIEQKNSKVAFQVKCRIVYLAKKESFNKAKGVAGTLGALQQFTALNLNGFAPVGKVTTGADYFFKERRIAERQRRILRAFKDRGKRAGWGNGMVLNTEELATVWHFPVATVKAPLVKTSETKRGEPPSGLPIERDVLLSPPPAAQEEAPPQQAPENLPI